MSEYLPTRSVEIPLGWRDTLLYISGDTVHYLDDIDPDTMDDRDRFVARALAMLAAERLEK